jgi:hypothetical protein
MREYLPLPVHITTDLSMRYAPANVGGAFANAALLGHFLRATCRQRKTEMDAQCSERLLLCTSLSN